MDEVICGHFINAYCYVFSVIQASHLSMKQTNENCSAYVKVSLLIYFLCVIYVLLFLLLLYVLSCIFFVFPRYDKKLTCWVFDPSLLQLVCNTFTFIYKHMYLRDLEEDSFHSYPGPPICILLY